MAVRGVGWGPAAPAALIACIAALLIATISGSTAEPTGDAGLDASIAQAPLAFEPNAGRTSENVDYIAHSVAGGSL